ncbi:helix-turn-helix domain-containing protein [Saccharicrinis aurantiacus]|uniref:helix-turn-helix domain-containing protein n=1 Tax=Saccharicrinis aurantiacus TaxID=1849719 RepID=UPI0008381EAC|nr:helix-turn-helix domain-containing protein [Saccharicrinis aurantiacus]
MALEVITTDDLREFKIELLDEIKKLLKLNASGTEKKWLKSYEVKELLNISPGTLQHLRVSGILPYTKIGGTIYYDHSEIQKILADNKSGNYPANNEYLHLDT